MVTDLSQLELGDKIEISRTGHKDIKHVCQVLDILDEDEYIISGPIKRSSIVHIAPNTLIDISYSKYQKGKYRFKALVLQVYEKGIYKLRIKRNGEVIKIQERNYYRLPITLEVEKTFTVEEGIVIKENCITKDISGGGIAIFSNYDHNLRDELTINIKLRNKELTVKGQIIRISKTDKKNYKYEIGIKFVEIDSKSREEIVKYIFNKQRVLRKKGLI